MRKTEKTWYIDDLYIIMYSNKRCILGICTLRDPPPHNSSQPQHFAFFLFIFAVISRMVVVAFQLCSSL